MPLLQGHTHVEGIGKESYCRLRDQDEVSGLLVDGENVGRRGSGTPQEEVLGARVPPDNLGHLASLDLDRLGEAHRVVAARGRREGEAHQVQPDHKRQGRGLRERPASDAPLPRRRRGYRSYNMVPDGQRDCGPRRLLDSHIS